MKTQHSNLAFNKSAIIGLNDNQLQNVNGGSVSGINTSIINQILNHTR